MQASLHQAPRYHCTFELFCRLALGPLGRMHLLRSLVIRLPAAASGVTDTWDNLYSFFLNRVRDNLHIVLCFSPVGDKFSRRAQQFPGLINGTTIDWFLPWPEEALTSGEQTQVQLGACEHACGGCHSPQAEQSRRTPLCCHACSAPMPWNTWK